MEKKRQFPQKQMQDRPKYKLNKIANIHKYPLKESIDREVGREDLYG